MQIVYIVIEKDDVLLENMRVFDKKDDAKNYRAQGACIGFPEKSKNRAIYEREVL